MHTLKKRDDMVKCSQLVNLGKIVQNSRYYFKKNKTNKTKLPCSLGGFQSKMLREKYNARIKIS